MADYSKRFGIQARRPPAPPPQWQEQPGPKSQSPSRPSLLAIEQDSSDIIH